LKILISSASIVSTIDGRKENITLRQQVHALSCNKNKQTAVSTVSLGQCCAVGGWKKSTGGTRARHRSAHQMHQWHNAQNPNIQAHKKDQVGPIFSLILLLI